MSEVQMKLKKKLKLFKTRNKIVTQNSNMQVISLVYQCFEIIAYSYSDY